MLVRISTEDAGLSIECMICSLGRTPDDRYI